MFNLTTSQIRKIVGGLIAIICLIVFWVAMENLVVDVPAGKHVVKQSFGTGHLEVFSEPGWKWQGFGNLTEYDKSNQLWFTNRNKKDGTVVDYSLPIRFSDGGTARIHGSLRYDLPGGEKLIDLHQKYKSGEAIERELLIPVIQKSIQFSGPVMTSKESAAARRNDLLTIIEDQMVNGVYKTDIERIQVDDITSDGGKKWVDVLRPVQDKNAPNGIARAEVSPIQSAGIKVHAIAVTDINYDDRVEDAIRKQYDLEMEVQTAKTAAITANQKVVTAEAEGRAKEKEAEWQARELAKKQIVEADRDKQIAETQAKQKFEVAKLDKQAAEAEREAQIARAEGEAKAMELVASARKKQMEADGALEAKLKAYENVNKAFADAISKVELPQVMLVSGGKDGQGSSSPVNDLLNMLNSKAASDLLNMGVDLKTQK